MLNFNIFKDMELAVKHFIHFGCWNYGECGNPNPVTTVTTAVNEAIAVGPVDYVIVAGDNYYPIKNKGFGEDKLKLINKNMLDSGFGCLPTEVDTYILFGNHDLDNSNRLRLYNETGTVTDMTTLTDVTKISIPSPCEIMRSEIRNRPNLIFPPPGMVTHRIDGNTLILMIDTTMYDISKDKSGNVKDKDGNLVCYEMYYGDSDLNTLMERQHQSVMEILSTIDATIHNIMLVGHHPLLYPKIKDANVKISYLTMTFQGGFVGQNG